MPVATLSALESQDSKHDDMTVPVFTSRAMTSRIQDKAKWVGSSQSISDGTAAEPTLAMYKLTTIRRNYAVIMWDPDDFVAKPRRTWAPKAPRRQLRPTNLNRDVQVAERKSVHNGGGSFRFTANDFLGTSPKLSMSSTVQCLHSPSKSRVERLARSNTHSDPIHKRDLVIKPVAYGWSARRG